MAARKLEAEDLKHIEELAKGWGKIIVRQQWGEQGPGLDVDLTEMEDVAMAASALCWRGPREVATQRQASQLGLNKPVPIAGRCACSSTRSDRLSCGRAARSEHHEPVAHCPACRWDFSLSVRC